MRARLRRRDHRFGIPRLAGRHGPAPGARLGVVAGNTGQLSLANKEVAKAFELRDRTSEYERLYITAYYYQNSGQLDKTIEAWELMKQTYPRDEPSRINVAVAYQQIGRNEKSVENCLEAIRLEPASAHAHLQLGALLSRQGKHGASIASLREAIRLAPDGPNLAIAYWALGTSQLLLGRVDQAIDLLQTARAANPRLWVPYLYLAGAYGLKGDLDKAKAALAESIRLKPAIKSLARMQAENRWLTDPRYQALEVKTLNVGLHRAGLPDQ